MFMHLSSEYYSYGNFPTQKFEHLFREKPNSFDNEERKRMKSNKKYLTQ